MWPGEENTPVSVKILDKICREGTGRPFAELSANLGYKSSSEVKQIVKQVKKCVRVTQKKCVAEYKKQLDGGALQAVHATDTSYSKYERIR